ncbi:MAG: zinc metallopeptidase [Clostridia bacterium]
MDLYTIVTLCLLPAIIIMLIVGGKTNVVFKRYSNIISSSGYTGAECARKILDSAGLYDTKIVPCRGNLTDNFDPRTNTVSLSEMVYKSQSVSALGVAAHEVGHAIQYADDYAFVKIRTALVPVCNFTSRFSLPLIVVGLVLEMFLGYGNVFSSIMFFVGVGFYAVYTLFTLVTLPVEYNASNRAREQLLKLEIVSVSDESKIKEVLNAAAKTYVMSFALSFLYLLRYIAMFGRRNDK